MASLWYDDLHGPLPALLLVLTAITGLVDAVSFFKLGHVFVANMTGNVVFLGFAVAGATYFSAPASLVAIFAFLAGAVVGGRLGVHAGHHRGRFFALATCLEIAVFGAALVTSIASANPDGTFTQYALLVLLALAMGLQNATARRLGVPDMTTTVLTLTLTGIAADSTFARGPSPNRGRRLAATGTMFLGAAAGAFLIIKVSLSAALGVAFVLLLLNGIASYRLWSSSEAWTVGA
jgi:uncharacterized membrane protein YoaK (UPF0700 family)